MFLVLLLQPRPQKRSGSENDAPLRIGAGSFSETRFVKGIFLIRERPAHNHDRALSK